MIGIIDDRSSIALIDETDRYLWIGGRMTEDEVVARMAAQVVRLQAENAGLRVALASVVFILGGPGGRVSADDGANRSNAVRALVVAQCELTPVADPVVVRGDFAAAVLHDAESLGMVG